MMGAGMNKLRLRVLLMLVMMASNQTVAKRLIMLSRSSGVIGDHDAELLIAALGLPHA